MASIALLGSHKALLFMEQVANGRATETFTS